MRQRELLNDESCGATATRRTRWPGGMTYACKHHKHNVARKLAHAGPVVLIAEQSGGGKKRDHWEGRTRTRQGAA